jgi:hypothetical protein
VTLTDRAGNPVRDDDGKTYVCKIAAGDDPHVTAQRITREFRLALLGKSKTASDFNGQLPIQKPAFARQEIIAMTVFLSKQPSSRDGTTQTIAFTGSSVATSNKLGPQTYQVCLSADSACCYSISDGAQTATTGSPMLLPNILKYVTVSPGQLISAIRASTDGLDTATSGTLWVTELS